MQTKPPKWEKKVSQFRFAQKRLRETFNVDFVVVKGSNNIGVYYPYIDSTGDARIKEIRYDGNSQPTYIDLDVWNDLLVCIHLGFVFPNQNNFCCLKCGCPDIEDVLQNNRWGDSRYQCKNCDKKYYWTLID